MAFALYAGPYVLPVLVGFAPCSIPASGRIRLPAGIREHFRRALVIVPERADRALRLYALREWNLLDAAIGADEALAAPIVPELAIVTPVGDDGRLTVSLRLRSFIGGCSMLGCGPFVRLAPESESAALGNQRDTPLKAVMARPCWLEPPVRVARG